VNDCHSVQRDMHNLLDKLREGIRNIRVFAKHTNDPATLRNTLIDTLLTTSNLVEVIEICDEMSDNDSGDEPVMDYDAIVQDHMCDTRMGISSLVILLSIMSIILLI